MRERFGVLHGLSRGVLGDSLLCKRYNQFPATHVVASLGPEKRKRCDEGSFPFEVTGAGRPVRASVRSEER